MAIISNFQSGGATSTITTLNIKLPDYFDSDETVRLVDLSDMDEPQVGVNVFPVFTHFEVEWESGAYDNDVDITWKIDDQKWLVADFDFRLGGYLTFLRGTALTIYCIE